MTLTTSICIFSFIFCDIVMQVAGEYCKEYGRNCPVGLSCCGTTCCATENYHHGFRWSVWNMWYFWFIVIFLLMSCFGGCGYWRRRQLVLHQQQTILQHQQAFNNYVHQTAYSGPPHTSVPVPPYGASGPPPTTVQPEGSFPAPPPYSEVTKPYLYSPNKDDLPPYPEGPYSTEYSHIMTANNQGSEAAVMTVDGTVPGLPPYSAVVESAPASYQPQLPQQPATDAQPVSPPSGAAENYSVAPAAVGGAGVEVRLGAGVAGAGQSA